MPKGKSHHVHHHFPQYTNVIVMVVIFIVGIAIGVGGKDVLKGGGLVGKAVGAVGFEGGTGSTGSEGNIGETGGTTGTDTSECGDYSDTSVYEGDNTVVNYRVYDNDENLVWTGSDIQTYYDEHLEKNPCGDDGENTYGWYESNGFSENICSTGPDTNPSLDPDFPLLGIPGTTVSVDEVDADGTTASGDDPCGGGETCQCIPIKNPNGKVIGRWLKCGSSGTNCGIC